MKQITIYKNNIQTNQGRFETQELADEWLKDCLAKNKFGLPERPEVDEKGESTGNMLPAEFVIVKENILDPVIALPNWFTNRRREFSQIDHIRDEAISEFLFEGRNVKAQEYKALRLAIKQKYPKPE